MAKGLPDGGQWIMIIVVAVAILYLVSTIVKMEPCTPKDITDEVWGCNNIGDKKPIIAMPETQTLQKGTIDIFGIIIVGLAVMMAYFILTRMLGGTFSRQTVFALIIVAILLYLVWDLVLSKALGSAGSNILAWKLAHP